MRTILIIEDEPLLAKSITDYLRSESFLCEWAPDFATAETKLASFMVALLFCTLSLLLSALAPCAVAAAASPSGTLAQLAGAGGCASAQTAFGCTSARGLDDARAGRLCTYWRGCVMSAHRNCDPHTLLASAMVKTHNRFGPFGRRRSCWRRSFDPPP